MIDGTAWPRFVRYLDYIMRFAFLPVKSSKYMNLVTGAKEEMERQLEGRCASFIAIVPLVCVSISEHTKV